MGLYRQMTLIDNGTQRSFIDTLVITEPLKLGEGIRESKQSPLKIDLQPE